jgi:acyl carrier protein
MNTTNRRVRIHTPDNGAHTIDVMRSVLVERFGIAVEQLVPDQALDTLGLDSLGFVEYIFELEKALNITLPDVPRDIATVGALVGFIDSEVKAQSGSNSPT